MAEIVNLKRARKRREREARDQQAEANRLQFGRSKRDRAPEKLDRAKAAREHEGKKLEP